MPLAKQKTTIQLNNQSYSTFSSCKPKAESLGEHPASSCHLFRVAEGTLAYTQVFLNAQRRLLQLDPGYSWEESKRHTARARQVFFRCV